MAKLYGTFADIMPMHILTRTKYVCVVFRALTLDTVVLRITYILVLIYI